MVGRGCVETREKDRERGCAHKIEKVLRAGEKLLIVGRETVGR